MAENETQSSAPRLLRLFTSQVSRIVNSTAPNTGRKSRDIIDDLLRFVQACNSSPSPSSSSSSSSTHGSGNNSSLASPTSLQQALAQRHQLALSSQTLGPSSSFLSSSAPTTSFISSFTVGPTLPLTLSNSLNSPNQPNGSAHSIDITAELDQIVVWMYGDVGADRETTVDHARAASCVQDLIANDLLAQLFFNTRQLSFEGRKALVRIFEYSLLQCRDITVAYIDSPERVPLLHALVASYDCAQGEPSIALCADAIFRACIVHDPICETIFNVSPSLVLPFLRYVNMPNFDVSSHAFDTLHLMLTLHDEHAANFLRENYDSFFAAFNPLLTSESFLTKVNSFGLLSELLLKPSNHDIMIKYVNDPENLKVAMITLRSQQKALQLAAFNVLKVFVPNPFKADAIQRILVQNKRNFLNWLTHFEKDSTDESLRCHRLEMIDALNAMPDQISPSFNPLPPPNV